MSKWISVHDRLPEIDQTVLFATSRGGVYAGYYMDKDFPTHWKERGDEDSFQDLWDVTHWMPLPQPPGDSDN